MTSATRILHLAPCSPTGSSSGVQMRVSQIARALQAIGQVDSVVVSYDKEQTTELQEGGFRIRRIIKLRPIGGRSPWERLRCGFDPRFINYQGHAADDEDRMFVLHELPKYDLVWFHYLITANVFGQWAWPRSVMDLADIPSSFFRTAWQTDNSLGQRLRATFRMQVARARERVLDERFNVFAVCSDADRKYLGLQSNVHVIPNGFAKPEGEPSRQIATPPRIGFIGGFDYAPNVEGVRWFAEKCWPLIKRQLPDARLRLVGKCSDGPAGPAGRDIDALGWLDDAAAEIATWSTMVVPIPTGGGTRVKIAEGFSRKCPIVSTSVGAYGYEIANGRELFLADSAEDFSDACVKVIQEPVAANAMANRAWLQFLEKWTWDAIRPRVWQTAEDCLRQSAATSSGS